MTEVKSPRYDEHTEISIPIEIRTEDTTGNKQVLCAWADDVGLISYSVAGATRGVALSLDYVGGKIPYPRKAVQGWQAEVIAFVESGYGKITEVR
jgi:hypothetical protein